MKTCILTVIKNEHLYLDEWIKYHLDIGVDHLFIFEDIDSGSHKSITDKYGDKVSLARVSDVLSESDLVKISEFKMTKLENPQRIYLNRALFYIKNHFDYDWCFVIDNDEFITLENETSNIKEILSLYDDYDALILSWKIYGASGLVHKPDYSVKGVVDTFTSPAKGYIPIYHPSYDKKTCFHLTKFKEEYWRTIHSPNDKCNYCDTNFVKNNVRKSYKNIYLRHYVTKSWEEYLWKKTSRGYFMGFARSFDAFFKINSDMSELKEELLSKVDDEVLVVLPYSNKGAQGNEVRLALSGWRKFCKSRYHFVVIGEFSEQLKEEFPWVEFIYEPALPKKEGQYNPHLDIQHKMEIVYNLFKDRYDGFIRIADDQYAIRPFYTYEIKTIRFHEDEFIGRQDAPTFFWKHDQWKTRQLIDKNNLPHINYTTHFPYYFEFDKLKEIWDKFNMREESYVLENVYFNYFKHVKPMPDKDIRFGVWKKNDLNDDFKKAIKTPRIKFICNSVEGWSKELESSLEEIICQTP